MDAPIGIVSAMHEELRALLPLLEGVLVVEAGGRQFHTGSLHGRPVVLVLSGIGKVASAATATLLLARFAPAMVLMTGVAGGLAPGVAVGDVVVADALLQHDLDASPLFPRFEVPLTGRARFPADARAAGALHAAALAVAANARAAIGGEALQALGIAHGALRVHRGLVVTGDRFVSTSTESDALRALLPDALAVEMEGAAMAQVCADFHAPFAVVRVVSDRADDAAHVDFQRFVDTLASVFTRALVAHWLARPPR